MNNSELLFQEAAERLRRTAQEGRSFGAAQVKIIGLDKIRQRTGADWTRTRDRVRTNSSDFLQSRLSRDDLVIPCGDGFLIVYAESEGRDLAGECEQLRTALDTFYLGEEETAELRTQVAAKSVTPSEMIAVIGAPARDPDPARKTLMPTVRFMPAWNVTHEVVSIYIAGPTISAKTLSYIGYDEEYRYSGQHKRTDYLALDLQILDRAVSAAKTMLVSGKRCLIAFSVHASTLQKRISRSAYREQLVQIPTDVRPYLIGRVAEIECGAPSVTISEWVSFLRHFVSRVMLELHPRQKHFSGLDSVRAWAASCALPIAAPANAEGRERTRALVQRWNDELHKQGLLFLLDNVSDLVMLGGARIDFASGEALWPFVDVPAGIVPCQRLSLMRSSPRTNGVSASAREVASRAN